MMTYNDIELLAPAGSWEAFIAAVENGANAVYLGGKLFNARQYAGNFDSKQLKDALDYAHLRNVKVYLTMNTLLNDNEIEEAVNQTEEAYKMGIDGIIVQDLGFAKLIKGIFPDLDLHASTQMTVYNIEGVKTLEKLGFRRAVLARELSIAEIEHISKATPLEIEVFIHGALCVSYSGQCLMSSVIGGRSGNRGKCAQPCRLKYELVGGVKAGSGHIMSPKDICSITELKSLANAGVKSLKIEGRMKTPEYVATVVKIYRKYLDDILAEGKGRVNEEDMKDLTQIFNRGGFSKGYLMGKTGRDMMSYEKPKNWGLYLGDVLAYDKNTKTVKVKLKEVISTGDGVEVWNGSEESPGTIVTDIKVNGKRVPMARVGEIAVLGSLKGKIFNGNKIYRTSEKRLNISARESFEGKSKVKSPISGKISIKKDQPITLRVEDNAGNKIDFAGDIHPETAINRPLTLERLTEQISKTGNTPFKLADLEVELEEGLSVPVSELNNLRRGALEKLESKIIHSFERNMSKEMGNIKNKLLHFPGNSRKASADIKISLFMYAFNEGIDLSGILVDRVYLPFSAMFQESSRKKLKQVIKSKTGEIYLWLPNVTRGNYDRIIKTMMDEAVELGIDGILAGNIWQFELLKEFPHINVMGDYTLNPLNSYSLEQLFESGLKGTTLSLELNLSQLAQLKTIPGFQKEVVVYGRIPVMTSEYCPVGSIEGGHNAKSKCKNACINGSYRLKDRMGMEFPVICDRIDCRSIILNSNVIFTADSVDKIASTGVDIMRLNVFDESIEKVKLLVNMHRDILANGMGSIGKYSRFVEEIKNEGHTKGHYFRGV